MSYGGGYNGGGYVGQSSYAGRSAQRAPTTAKKHMLKLVILGDSGYVVYNLCYCFMSIAMLHMLNFLHLRTLTYLTCNMFQRTPIHN